MIQIAASYWRPMPCDGMGEVGELGLGGLRVMESNR